MDKPTYTWGFGIDWESVPKSDGKYYLQPTLARKDPGVAIAVPDDPTGMPAGSRVEVVIFDTTKSKSHRTRPKDASERITETVDSFDWEFMNARGQTPSNPFQTGALEVPQLILELGSLHSVALRGNFPAFAVSNELSLEPASFEISHEARGHRFFFWARVIATRIHEGSLEKRTFFVDPEMEIGDNGDYPRRNRGCLWRLFQ